MPSKHLFLFANYRVLKWWVETHLESKAMYSTGSRYGVSSGYRNLTINGESIHLDSVENLDRIRGYNFKGISLHESVELTMELHSWIQMAFATMMMGMRVVLDPEIANDRMIMISDEHIKKFQREMSDRIIAQMWSTSDIKIPEFKGLINGLGV